MQERQKRRYDPSEATPSCSRNVESLATKLSECAPSTLWLRYCPQETQAATHQEWEPPIKDEEDLWGAHALNEVAAHMKAQKPLTREEIQVVTKQTLKQAQNKTWHQERRGRMTASMFSRLVRCIKPEWAIKQILYPGGDAYSEALSYGRRHEDDAVVAYTNLKSLYDVDVQVFETGLHIHPGFPFIAASPDRLVTDGKEEGLLEVKCPITKKGMTPEAACQDKKFCCEMVNGEVTLKTTHAYYYQVQGQMAVTGHTWCDFVVWTNNTDFANSTSIERVMFDKSFWVTNILPGLLYFAEHALFPEVITKRVKRLGQLYTKGKYVPFKKYCAGYYVCEAGDGLKMKIKKLK